MKELQKIYLQIEIILLIEPKKQMMYMKGKK